MIPLEDTAADIIGKAMRGLRLTEAQVADAAGVAVSAVESLRGGTWDELVARKIAPVLGLGADAFAAVGGGQYTPPTIALDGLAQFNTPFEDYTVNAYLVWDPASGEAAAFDTGSDVGAMLDFAAEKSLKITRIFLTHTHGDHVFDLEFLREKTGAPAVVSSRESIEGAEPFEAGTAFKIGGLSVETRLTWGHSPGGITYVVTGLAQPVAVVGDALFAGSMGGGVVSYEAALQTNREQILTLPGDTIVAPGHGPLTTVAAEQAHNPFFTASRGS
jgi:glyoxylase-like metal-dependent hydrolase (beta-lactamase superfamily II)